MDQKAPKELQREAQITKLLKEITGYYGALGRRVHSSGKKRQCFLGRREDSGCLVSADDTDNFFGVNSGLERSSMNSKVILRAYCPIYIS